MTALLWFDDNPTHTLADIVRAAAARYRRKFGAEATCCLAHRGMCAEATEVDGVKVEAGKVGATPPERHVMVWRG